MFDTTVAHAGFTIRIHLDSDTRHPWKEFDCQPPLIVYSDRCFNSDHGDSINSPLSFLTDWQVARHWRAIAAALGESERDFDRWSRDIAQAYKMTLAAARRDQADSLLSALTGQARIGALEALLKVAGIVTYRTTSTGYTQSSWAEILLAYTPAHQAACGGTPSDAEKLESLKADAALWSAWAWGDVYGYTVEDEDGDEVDSCWGFYGSDHEASGLLDQARNAAECAAADRAANLSRQKDEDEAHD